MRLLVLCSNQSIGRVKELETDRTGYQMICEGGVALYFLDEGEKDIGNVGLQDSYHSFRGASERSSKKRALLISTIFLVNDTDGNA